VIKIKICIKYKTAFGWNIEKVFGNYIKCSRSDSHVNVLKLPSVSETDSVPIFRLLLMVW